MYSAVEPWIDSLFSVVYTKNEWAVLKREFFRWSFTLGMILPFAENGTNLDLIASI